MLACARCHAKKIKCNGPPNCRNCVKARSPCRPHTRFKVAEAYDRTSQRLAWIEAEISTLFKVDCASIPTGTPLAPIIGRGVETPAAETIAFAGSGSSTDASNKSSLTSASTHPSEHPIQVPATEAARPVQGSPDAVDIGLLALNATGELRYLGPSSGSFLFNVAASLARTSGPDGPVNLQRGGLGSCARRTPSNREATRRDLLGEKLSPEVVQLLTISYKLWMQPLYPLLNDDDLNRMESGYSNQDKDTLPNSSEEEHNLISFYLVMALGAINLPNTVKQLHITLPAGQTMAPADSLYEKAIGLFEYSKHAFRPSLSLIEALLLICINASFRATGYTQWQLTGLAMRMSIEIGLHCSHHNGRIPPDEVDRRSRVFWTVYLIETSLAYNLGRPPSISDAHITVKLPECTEEMRFSLHHLKHRRIQSRIINSVYATDTAGSRSLQDSIKIINDLQVELDGWKKQIYDLSRESTNCAYSISYWERLHGGTSSVLHRPSPLCPQPSADSAVRCVRSAGAYIESLLHSLRSSHAPLTWMIVQGALFAGITMLVVTRLYSAQIMAAAGSAFVLVDFPRWTRKCSMCMAVLGERWEDGLLQKLEAHFEVLANDTLERIASPFTNTSTSATTGDRLGDELPAVGPGLSQTSQGTAASSSVAIDSTAAAPSVSSDAFRGDVPSWSEYVGFGAMAPSDLDSMTLLNAIVDMENGQAFWDVFMTQSGFDVLDAFGHTSDNSSQNVLSAGSVGSSFHLY